MGVTLGVTNSEQMRAHFSKGDRSSGKFTINIGTTVIWLSPAQARRLAEVILEALEEPAPGTEPGTKPQAHEEHN